MAINEEDLKGKLAERMRGHGFPDLKIDEYEPLHPGWQIIDTMMEGFKYLIENAEIQDVQNEEGNDEAGTTRRIR